ncbi:glycosyltransferase family 2 protein [Ensifer sp. 4252]|uniref:glycosyltransferase family 2 protein n=1 Tax=Ensifer sp. 4252 TaxID=3373915 RepID=UPI003D1D2AA0
MPEKSKIVVVFPVHNGAKTLERSLRSIADQSLHEFKALILENGSTDDTLEIARAFCAGDPRFSVIQNENFLSALEQFAKAIRLGACEGEYFCLRACDDTSTPDFLQKLVASLDEDPNKMLAVGNVDRINGAKITHVKPNQDIFRFKERYLRGRVPRNLMYPSEWIYGVFRSSAANEIILKRWYEGAVWALSSYVVTEFVVRDLVAYTDGPAYEFTEGSGSDKKYMVTSVTAKIRARWQYTIGCYKLKDKLPPASLYSRLMLFRMCWNDARRKTRYRILGL